ncbi:hypothetical protein Purlil1_13600 [Purpureocillium lilacinum]|uniref:Uncharacterized protein n=1 Tax=Purpureocillium lilacinum TaxID=33203 RepID=A0ABR0BDL3_PURLI|nr:hypothetical protein Purlil1_13600 [Purpureocillium lilacinum]
MATAMGSHAGSDPFDLDNHVLLNFRRPGPCCPAPKQFSGRGPADRCLASATAIGPDAIFASTPTLQLCCQGRARLYRRSRQQGRTRTNGCLQRQISSLPCILRIIRPGFLDFWRQSLSILPPATAPTYSSVAAGRSPLQAPAGHTATPSVEAPPSAPQQTADIRLQGRPIPAPPKEDLRVFVRLDAEAPARKLESYAIRTHIAAKVGIDLHQIPAAFPVNSGWALRATDTATRDLIVQRQSEWAQDLGANTVETSRKWYTYVVTNCPRRLTDLQGNEAADGVGRYSKHLDKALPGTHTRLLYDSLKRSESNVLAQLRTGMMRLNSYLSKIGAVESSLCECGQV